MKKLIIFLFVASLALPINAQVGGSHAFEFLNLSNSARVAAMGGNFLAIRDNDINLAIANPSLITSQMDNNLALSFINYFSGINYGYAAYSRSFNKFGSYVGSVQFVDYGTFTLTDQNEQILGSFHASEYAFGMGWGRSLDSSFSIGSNVKFVYSALEEYNSTGILADLAASYTNTKHEFTFSLLARNIGRQLTTYTENNIEPLPFELQCGLSKKLKHVPLRYSILYRHLEKFNLTYEDPNNPTENTDPLTGEPLPEKKFEKFADKFMRHLILGAEFCPTKNFNVWLGYNYQKRKEMKLESRTATVGFSWGFGLRISKFNFSYARSAYHLAGSPNYITLTTNLSSFCSKK